MKVYICVRDYGHWKKGALAAFEEIPNDYTDYWEVFLFELE